MKRRLISWLIFSILAESLLMAVSGGYLIYLPYIRRESAPTQTATATQTKPPLIPTPTKTQAPPPPCDCTGTDLDCSDFPTHDAAQACFNYCYPQYGDIFRLDGDNDGLACELLP